jgi:hypothetical protein
MQRKLVDFFPAEASTMIRNKNFHFKGKKMLLQKVAFFA